MNKTYLDAIDEVVSSFGKRKYATAQMRALTELAGRYGADNFIKVCEELILNHRSRPTPADFQHLLRQKYKPIETGEVHQDGALVCKDCIETGYVFLDVPGSTVLGKCHCKMGRLNQDPWCPQITGQYRNLIAKFPKELFKPDAGNMSSKIEWWEQQKMLSRDYWKRSGMPQELAPQTETEEKPSNWWDD
jgi:hypothetical protein